jgi:hypothetical protein
LAVSGNERGRDYRDPFFLSDFVFFSEAEAPSPVIVDAKIRRNCHLGSLSARRCDLYFVAIIRPSDDNEGYRKAFASYRLRYPMNRIRTAQYVLAALAFVFSFTTALTATADIICSTLDPSDPQSGIDVIRGGFSFQKVAAPFVLTGDQDYVLQTAEVLIEDYAPSLHTLNVRVFTGLDVPDTEIAATSIATAISDPYLATADFSTQLTLLSPGTKYWLEADLTGSDQLLWYVSSSDINGAAYSNGSPQWQVDRTSAGPAFRINGTPVPEPTTATLLLPGMLWLVASSRIRRLIASSVREFKMVTGN